MASSAKMSTAQENQSHIEETELKILKNKI
jgi:hypothetical protein